MNGGTTKIRIPLQMFWLPKVHCQLNGHCRGTSCTGWLKCGPQGRALQGWSFRHSTAAGTDTATAELAGDGLPPSIGPGLVPADSHSSRFCPQRPPPVQSPPQGPLLIPAGLPRPRAPRGKCHLCRCLSPPCCAHTRWCTRPGAHHAPCLCVT